MAENEASQVDKLEHDSNQLLVFYTDVGRHVRHWESMRLARFTVLIATTAGIISFTSNSGLDELLRVALDVGGLVSVFLFWIMDYRGVVYWRSYREVAEKIEIALGYREEYISEVERGLFTSGNAARAFFFLLACFWLLALLIDIGIVR